MGADTSRDQPEEQAMNRRMAEKRLMALGYLGLAQASDVIPRGSFRADRCRWAVKFHGPAEGLCEWQPRRGTLAEIVAAAELRRLCADVPAGAVAS